MKPTSPNTERSTYLRKSILVGSLLFILLLVFGFSRVAGAALPDMPNVVKPNPEPGYPAGFDTFAPRVDSSIPTAGAPIVVESTKIAGPGESVSVIGDNLSLNTRFIIFSQNTPGNGILLDAKVQRLDAPKKAVLTLPELKDKMPSWSTAFIWLKNNFGTSRPMVINQTNVTWVHTKPVTVGETTTVYGYNLAHGNGATTSWVYIKPASGSGKWAAIVSVNPYRVQFKVPSGLSNGSYQVWVHNGHGGKYGWSKSPNDLTVWSGQGWTSTTFNVKSYGAVGEGTTDDTQTIKNAIAASANSPKSTVYFPTGTYKISGTLNASSNQRWMGDGKTASIITVIGSANPAVNINNKDLVEIRDMKIDSSSVTTTNIMIGGWSGGTASNIWITNIETFASTNGVGIALVYSSSIYLNGCKITGAAMGNTWGCTKFYVDNCSYYGRGGGHDWMQFYGMRYLTITNSTFQDYNPAGYDDPNSKNLDFIGRVLFQCPGDDGMANSGLVTGIENEYIGNNTTYGMGFHRIDPQKLGTNGGEQFSTDEQKGQLLGVPVSADATHIMVGAALSPLMQAGYIVVNRGKGEGQLRKIIGYDSGTNTAAISPDWTIIPDNTSYCSAQTLVKNVTFYNNNLQGHDNYATFQSASTGIQNYAATANSIIANNTIRQVGCGLTYWTFWQGKNVAVPGNYGTSINNYYINNDIAKVNCGVALQFADWDRTNLCNDILTSFGLMVRNNKIDGAGISIGAAYSTGLEVMERNTITNAAIGIDIGPWGAGNPDQTFNLVFSKNRLSGSRAGVSVASGVKYKMDLQGNTYSGYKTVYAGSAPGYVLEAPYRFIEMDSANPKRSIQVWNSGTAAMNWTAGKDAAWLKLSATSGSAPVEGGNNITITCNPSGLAVGTHSGTITVTAGAQTKKVTVNYKVTAHLQDLSVGQYARCHRIRT